MSKQKLLIVITKGNWGGAQRYVYDLATNLPKRQFEVTVAVGEGSILPSRLAEEGIRAVSLPALGRDVRLIDDWKSFLFLLKLFRHEKPDIIHLNSSKAGVLGTLAGRIYNLNLKLKAKNYNLEPARIIFTAHGWAFNENRSGLARAVIAILHWLTILLAHRTIVVAEATRRQMRHFPFANRRMVVVRNGLPKINFLDRPSARAKLLGGQVGTRGSSRWLGTISELHGNKGLKYLIQAIAMSRLNLDNGRQGLTLTIIIIGEGEERQNLEQQIKAAGLENTVFLLGRQDNAAQYLKAFDIFTLTSITEAFPYTILEAGAAGLPVLASGVGGIPEIVKSMESGILVKPRQPSEIAHALEFLITHPAKMTQFGQALRRRVIKEFSTGKMVKETIAVYNNEK